MKYKRTDKAFTLLELIIVMSVITLLLSLIVPGLRGARHMARQIVCLANVSAIADGMVMYSMDTRDKYPAAYTYMAAGSGSVPLINHWSDMLIKKKLIDENQLSCPAFANRGLPPRSTSQGNLEEEQVSAVEGEEDHQAGRCAYTVNEAIFPRNRFTVGFEGAIRVNRYVSSSELKNTADLIMITEWTTDWKVVREVANGPISSYLPVHGVKALASDYHNDLNSVPILPGKPCFTGGIYEKCLDSELSLWQSAQRVSPPRLDWIGRNHGSVARGNKDMRRSCFAYADGHAECKSVFETLGLDFEWGKRIYSIASNNNTVK